MADFEEVTVSVKSQSSTLQNIPVTMQPTVPTTVTVSVRYPAGYRSNVRVYLQLDPALLCQGKALNQRSAFQKTQPNQTFTGHPTSVPYVPKWDDASDNKSMMLAEIPEGVLFDTDDGTNEEVLSWDVTLRGTISEHVEDHRVVAWVMEMGSAARPSLPLVFDIVPPKPELDTVELSGQQNVYKDVKNTGDPKLRYWIRDSALAALTGTAKTNLAFAFVRLSTDGGKSWSPPQPATVDVHDKKKFTLDSLKGIPRLSADTLTTLQIQVSQSLAGNAHAESASKDMWSTSISLSVQADTRPPVIDWENTRTKFDAPSESLKLSVQSNDDQSGLAGIEYSLEGGKDRWQSISPLQAHTEIHEVTFDGAKTYDFRKGIYVRATDRCGNLCEATMVLIDPDAFEIEWPTDFNNMRLTEPKYPVVGLVSKNSDYLLPVASESPFEVVWPEGLVFKNTSFNYSDAAITPFIVCESTLILEDPDKVWQPIPPVRAKVNGAFIASSPKTFVEPGAGHGQYLPPRPVFDLESKTVTAHAQNIWLHGTFKESPLDSTLTFAYGIGTGPYQSVTAPQDNVKHTAKDASFSVRLPDDVFSEGSHKDVKLRIRYEKDKTDDAYAEVTGITIQVNSHSAVFGLPKLSVQGGKLIAEGNVQGPTGDQADNPVTQVWISWVGRDEDTATHWNATLKSGGSSNLWSFGVETKLTDVREMLRPMLFAQTKAGVKTSQPVIFPHAVGLVDVAIKVDNTPVNLTGKSSTWAGSHGVMAGKLVHVEVKVTPRVGISRMNVSARLESARQGESAPLVYLQKPTGGQNSSITVSPASFQSLQINKTATWDGTSVFQLLSLSKAAAENGCTMTFPLQVDKNAKGPHQFKVILTDPETALTAVKSAFQQDTTYVLTLNVIP